MPGLDADKAPAGRMLSLDAFRGFTMLLLLAEGTHLYGAILRSTPEGSLLHSVATQFTHHPWNGLRFWDLVQPAFMFIVGVALPFAVAKRKQLGMSDARITGHVLYRALVLLLLGVGLHSVYAGRLVWELWNVLAQLAIAYPLAFLLMRYRARSQVAASVALLLITELLYRQWAVPGFDQAFVQGHNFGAWMDLLLLGVGLHSVYAGRLVWELWNVLAQLAIAYPLAFLLMRYRARSQIAASVALLLITELLYRQWPVPGFDQAFVQAHNFGAWLDMLLMGKLNSGGWVAINCVPTAAHVIWGVLAGQLLRGNLPAAKKIQRLVTFGAICVVVGYALNPLTPIIKRIATSSFVIVSAGWCLLALALSYWLIDVRGVRKWAFPGLVLGMNSIFIYLFGETVGPQWVNPTVAIFTTGFFWWLGAGLLAVFTATVVLGLEWSLCYWLYRRRIFIRI